MVRQSVTLNKAMLIDALSTMDVEESIVDPYHKGHASRSAQIPAERKRFIAWDGEGANLHGEGKPQSYVLFGCSTGDYISSDKHLHTFEIIDFIVDIGRKNPDAFHVGFAFNYDANMIVQSLNVRALKALHKFGRITLTRKGVGTYHIQFRPSKWFSVTRYDENYDRKKNTHAKVTVKIYDLFGFFTKSFVKAYEELVGPLSTVVKEGKDARGDFQTLSIEYVQKYWRAEIEALRELAEELRRRLYGAGLCVTQWHGPGALASYALRQHDMKKHMKESPEEVREAARYAYAGGRFEIFKLGRVLGPIYSLDINSAYPTAISGLPDIATGEWRHLPGPCNARKLARFGVYRVRLLPRVGGTFLERAPGPLFHRDKMGNISFPWVLEGWYWTPEVARLLRLPSSMYVIEEGWEYRGGYPEGTSPFNWVEEMYRQRREWKAKGYGAQLALKLCMNSIYGKLAQRVGWNEDKRTAPAWHQLEWAGWVTSYCRGMLWGVLSRIPWQHLIAVETDGLYTTMSPQELGIEGSTELGGWEIDVYDELLYVQSGMAWLRKGDEWTCKRRGLDARTFGRGACEDYLRGLAASDLWPPYIGKTTRFIGMGAALNSKAPTKVRHCVWSTVDREIRPGQGGKRIHVHKQCQACADGHTAYEAAHDMSIRSLAYSPKGLLSQPHDIPWEDNMPEYHWRNMQDIGEIDHA